MPYTHLPAYYLLYGYNLSYTRPKGTIEPTLPNPPKAPLRLPSFRNFFGLFTPSLPSNTTIPNTPFTYSATPSSFTPTPTTPNHHIY